MFGTRRGDWGRGSRARGRGSYRGGDESPGRHRKGNASDEAEEQVRDLFSKKFQFHDEIPSTWKLPDPQQIFHHPQYSHRSLLDLRNKLNSVKSKLDDKEITSWHRHTKFTNRAGNIIPEVRKRHQPELCTQGWTKLHEILTVFNIVPDSVIRLNSLHLCEAPGAFVTSLNHYLKIHRMDIVWQWRATTLNPYYEGNSTVALIDQDRFMIETIDNWYFGQDNSGDITIWDNVIGLVEKVKKELKDVHLVTADGSIDCANSPAEQETIVSQLLFCETVAAFLVLRDDGTFILKSFTTLECQSACLLYLLATCFKKVNVYKPVSSKAGNSEQYIVCVGFKGRSVITDVHLNKLKQGFNATFSNRSLFPMASIPESFWAQLAECSLKFSTYQIHAIEENLRLYVCMKNSERKLIKEVKDICCEKFIERCKLKKLPRDKGILPSLHLDGVHGLHAVSLPVVSLSDAVRDRRTTGSFISRMTAIQRPWADTVQSIKLSGENYSVSTTGLSDAGKLVIHCLGYTGTGHEDEGIGSIDKEQSLSAIAVEPDDVFWLKSRHIQKSFDKQNLHTLDGKRVEKVTNSKFCSNESLRKLTGIIDKAEIIQSSNMADFAHIVSKSIPCHALLASNPPFYLNAEALNLAALDSLTGVVSQITIASEQCLSFVDLWGGPSGYGQYVYWTKCSHSIQGWGVVRSEVRSLHPSPMLARFVQWDTFQILGSVQGLNIVSNDTVNSIVAAVQSECPEGVQLVIGDVSSLPFGSHPPGNEECHTKQQFLTQCVCALKLMSHGGSFVCRLYSLLTRFSAALLYLLHSVFHEVALIKPITSSPVSPEQFIVCKGYVGCPTIICDLLLEVNNHISDLKQHQGYGHSGSTSDVLEIIPVQQLFDDTFYQYLASHNERMLKLQAHTLLKLEKYYLEPQVLSRDDISEKLKLGMLELLKLPKQIM